MFDHAKTRYIARVGGGYCEREEDVDRVARERGRARAEGRYGDAFLFWLYEGYSRAQHAALAIPPPRTPSPTARPTRAGCAPGPILGIGTHFALGYVACVGSWWWAPALAGYFGVCATVLNLFLATMMLTEARQSPA